jgi:CRISPR-associated protein Cmr2
MSDEFWALKIAALLHDPPGKVLALADHQPRAFQLMERALGPDRFASFFGKDAARLTGDEFRATYIGGTVKKADAVASAIDRAAFPATVNVRSEEYIRTALLKHPCSGMEVVLPRVRALSDSAGSVDRSEVSDLLQAQLNAAAQLVGEETDLRRVYLRLWRGLPGTVPDAETRVLPPDTRMVDHSQWQHMDATAAVATALPWPALLSFSIGPVQSFIVEARRTQDLWMGSYILSYLVWEAVRAIAEQMGPDAIVYPALRGQPLVDHWLHAGFEPPIWKAPDLRRLEVATFPNKVVALLPAVEAEKMAGRAMTAARAGWREIAAEVKARFPGGARGGAWDRIWHRQVEAEDWPEVYWSVLPWPDLTPFVEEEREAETEPDAQLRAERVGQAHIAEASAALALTEEYLGPSERVSRIWEVYSGSWPRVVNSGTLYGQLYTLADRGLDRRKRLRDFPQTEEDGEKDTISGRRSALRPAGSRGRQQLRRYWQEVAQALRRQGRYHEVKPDGSERLSAVAAVKRFAHWEYFRPKLGLEGGFPSTSRVAAAPFYVSLLEEMDGNHDLAETVGKHLDTLDDIGFPPLSKEAARRSLPYLEARAHTDLAWRLLGYDADALFEHTFSLEKLKREYIDDPTEDMAASALASCRALLRAAREANITPPPRYYAVLMFDGDEMGHWLGGDPDRLPKLGQAFHPGTLPLFEALPNASAWAEVIAEARPLSASLHNSISRALANFALSCVRQVVERRYPGRVVYAGGDDLLALLPANSVLAAARELRALFSGEASVRPNGDGWDVETLFGDTGCTGYLHVADEWLLTMGPTATGSAGIALAHHTYPLDAVLATARQAERRAKEVYDRDAVCSVALKRSGETVRVGSKWQYDGLDAVRLVETLRDCFLDGALASRLAYDVETEARGLVDLPDAQRARLSWLVRRHRDKEKLTDSEADQVAQALADLALGLDQGATRHPKLEDRQRGMVEMAGWVLLARFIARGGGD